LHSKTVGSTSKTKHIFRFFFFISSWLPKQTKPRKRSSCFFYICSTSLLSSGMQRQLIKTRRSKRSGKTFRRVDFAARFTSTLPTNCPNFPRILRCLMLFKAKINNNRSTDYLITFTMKVARETFKLRFFRKIFGFLGTN